MQEEFEKKIQERVHTFGIQPSQQVWDEVNAVLSKRTHRRVFVGWWILLGLLVIGGGVLWFEKDNIWQKDINQQPVITNNDTTHNNLVSTTPQNITIQKEKDSESKNDESNTAQQNQGIEKNDNDANSNNIKPANRAVATNTNPGNEIRRTQKKPPAVISSQAPQVQKAGVIQANGQTAQNTLSADNPAANTPTADKEPPTSLQAGNQPQAAGSENEITAKTETLPQGIKEAAMQPREPAKAVPAADSAGQQPGFVEKPVSIKKGPRHQWFFTVSGGTTQTISYGAFNSADNKAYANPVAQNVYALTSPAVFKYDITAPGTGFHITAGGEYELMLSPRWRVSAGLQVTYLSNTQKTGALYSNLLDITNGMYGNFSGATGQVQSSYFQSGPNTINKVVNKAWWLQVPVNFSFVVNPRAKGARILLTGGASVAEMINSEWLIPDARYGKLYYDKSVLNNTILSWQAGPLLQFRNRLKLGITYQQSFTTLAKKLVSPKLYWQNVSVNVSVPLKFKK